MNFTLAPIFTHNLVLQQNKPVCVWGTGKEGELVEAMIDNNKSSSFVKNGKWKLYLEPMKADKNKVMVVRSGNEWIEITGISIGEVWLAGGQSNMEYELRNSTGGPQMLKNDKPDVRFYYTPKYEYEDEKFEKLVSQAHWELFNENDAGKWSAVGYCFAKELSEKLGVTVGIIGCNWGGTSASAWMPEEDLREDSELSSYMEEIDSFNKTRTIEEQKKDYEDYLKYRSEWEPKCNKMYEENPNTDWQTVIDTIGDSKYPGPVNSFNPMRPGGLYKTMLSKVIEYSMAGVIYYQGESDDHKPGLYEKLFRKMILRWRRDNADNKLPFIAVSLPMHRYKQDPDLKNWPVIRKNQRLVIDSLSNAGLAVCTDLGEYNEIHPHDKRMVAHRLYLQAGYLVYAVVNEMAANGPRFDYASLEGSTVIIHLKYASKGFYSKSMPVLGFELAPQSSEGEDKDFEPATVTLCQDTIRVTNMNIAKPGYVRYLWTNYSEVNLFGTNLIPLEPFSIEL